MNPMELLIGRTLRAGLWLSVFIVLIGGILYLIQSGHEIIQYQELKPRRITSLIEVWQEILTFSPQGIIALGLLILLLTQLLRVALTALLFLQERDYFFVGISFIILGVLLYSIFWRD